MRRLKPVRYVAAGLAAGGLGLCSAAEEGRVDQVERAEVEAGEAELELQTIHIPPGDGDAAVWVANLTLEYGVSETLALGIEIETEAEDGEDLDIDSVGLQVKWVTRPDRETRLGIQSGLFVTADGGQAGSETFLIAETRRGRLDLVANAVIETGPGDWDEVTAGYSLRADHPAGKGLMLGLEAGGGFSGEGDDAHWIGPVLSLWPETAETLPAVELSLFLPLTSETPDLQLRLELERAF